MTPLEEAVAIDLLEQALFLAKGYVPEQGSEWDEWMESAENFLQNRSQ